MKEPTRRGEWPPGGSANVCLKCVEPFDEPEEVGGNCLCAVGDPCTIPGGTGAPGQKLFNNR